MAKSKREKFQQLSMPVVDVFLEIEEQMLINMAKQLKKHKSLLTEDGYEAWQLEQLKELEILRLENIKIIAKHAGMTIEEVTKMLQKAGYSTVKEQESDLQEGVAAGVLMAAPSIEESPVLESIIGAYQEQAKESFNLINGTMLTQAEQAYTDVLNKTVGKLLAGNITPQQALRESVREWSKKGIPALVDKAGRQWSTEAYVSTVTRSMSNNVANEMQDKRFEEYGVDIIEISSHMGARPKCAPFQGRLFSLSGTDSNYPPFSSTSYGQPDGLFGINCGHVKYAFIPGITEQRYQQYDEEENDEAYELSQQQRELERRIRHAKREMAMMIELDDEKGIVEADDKIKERQADLRRFLKKTGRTRRRGREQLY